MGPICCRSCGDRNRNMWKTNAKRKRRGDFPSSSVVESRDLLVSIRYRQFPAECPTFVLFSPLLLSFRSAFRFRRCIISRAIIQSEFDNHSAQRPGGPKGSPTSCRSELRLPAATDPRNSVTYFNVFPQPPAGDGGRTCRRWTGPPHSSAE